MFWSETDTVRLQGSIQQIGLASAYYSVEIVTQVNFDKIIDRIYLLFTSTFFPRHFSSATALHCIDSRLLPKARHKRKEGISLTPVLKDEEVGLLLLYLAAS